MHRRAYIVALLLVWAALAPDAARAAEVDRGPFEYGRMQVGFASGIGRGFPRPGFAGGETDEVLLVPFYPQFGVGISGPLGGEEWYAGAFALLVEGTVLVNTSPRSGIAGGGALLVRYDLLSVPEVVPYAEIGAGMLDLDFDLNDQRDGFNFIVEGGLGLKRFLTASTALSLAYRWQHLSNGGSAAPNSGIDTHQALLGISYYFPNVD